MPLFVSGGSTERCGTMVVAKRGRFDALANYARNRTQLGGRDETIVREAFSNVYR